VLANSPPLPSSSITLTDTMTSQQRMNRRLSLRCSTVIGLRHSIRLRDRIIALDGFSNAVPVDPEVFPCRDAQDVFEHFGTSIQLAELGVASSELCYCLGGIKG